MRKELYNLLCRELGAIAEIKHIDLWNRNVEFIEQEEGWERPTDNPPHRHRLGRRCQ